MDTLFCMLKDSIKVNQCTKQEYLEFWATDINFMNDATERSLFVGVLLDRVKHFAKKQKRDLTTEQELALSRLCYDDMYVISLSDEKLSDDLNMWRGYGNNGAGVCLGFDFSKVPVSYWNNEKHISVLEDVYSPRKCCYDPIQIEDSLIEAVFRELTQDGKDYFCDTISKAAIMSRIANISPYYKHKAYISESEWRFVLSSLGEISFNKYGNKIKPYRTFPIPLSALTSIMIGPCIKDSNTIIGIEYMIKSKLGNDFEIKYSAIPYRG